MNGAELARQARGRGRHQVAQLIALAEDVRPAVAIERDVALAQLSDRPSGAVVGITGTPGSGKSSLLARLAVRLTELDDQVSVAIVAVDPSSPTSGGALLGDRTRMNLDVTQSRVFFRSQASATALGGLAPSTYHVCRMLSLLYDLVIVETVGVGQSEADIRQLAQRVYLVLAPLGGDELQYLKAGIIEIPDAFVINKWDEPAAVKAYHQLRASLWLARPNDHEDVPIHRTSAKNGFGVDELAAVLLAIAGSGGEPLAARAPHFFRSWVREEWGRTGERHLLAHCGGAAAFLAEAPSLSEAPFFSEAPYFSEAQSFSAAQRRFTESLLAHLQLVPEA